jgi:hypothetical protein
MVCNIMRLVKRIKKSTLQIVLLVALLLGTVGTAYAYWASSVAGNNDSATATVTVGDGEPVTTTVTVGDQTSGGPLVPIGITGTNDVDLTFSVLWESDNEASADALLGQLGVTIDSIEINGVDYSGLFTVTVVSGEGSVTEDSAKDVVINVEFTNEPSDQTEYDLVAGEDLVITITFTVSPN